MKNILSWEDVKRFSKKHKLTIILTSVVTLILYIAFSLYNLYSAVVLEGIDEIEQTISQEEIVEIFGREPEDINADELRIIEENLELSSVEFRVYIEDQDQTPLNDPSLLKDFLILDEVVDYVEAEAGVEIPIDLDLAVIVSRRGGHPVLSVRIRTGDIEDNMEIATAYRLAFEEEVVPLIQNRMVYILDEEPALYEPTLLTQILENMRVFSPVGIIIGSIGAILVGAILGILIAIILGMRKGKVDELRILQEEHTDKILPLYRIKNKTDKEKQLEFAILYNNESTLVLSENHLDDDLIAKLEMNGVEVADDLSHSQSDKRYNKVIILTYLDETSIEWYETQRIQLKNMEAEIVIIQL